MLVGMDCDMERISGLVMNPEIWIRLLTVVWFRRTLIPDRVWLRVRVCLVKILNLDHSCVSFLFRVQTYKISG